MKTLYALGLAFLLAFTVTGCSLYFGEERDSDGAYCGEDGYYVNGEWASAQCPGGGNACASNEDCAAGCGCDSATGKCVEWGFCSQATDCPPGYRCDEQRSSCVPREGSCAGAIAPTCTNGAPKCAPGTVPLIEDGCYYDANGDGQFDCSAISECAAPPACAAYQHSADCSSASCNTVSRGIGCTTPNGTACQGGSTNCTCQSYVFDRCEARPGM